MNTRTRGYVKPSNSERASRLLATDKVLSFSQASKSLSSIYTKKTIDSDQNDNSELDIDSEFKIVFKYMGKKDLFTKTKALEDFISLCKSKEQNDLLKISRYWFRIYRKLANVIEWNIRQLAHQAQLQFVSAFDRDCILQQIEECYPNVEILSNVQQKEVSFQNLITMPAVMWTCCFDSYNQTSRYAEKVFKYLYSDEEQIVKFLLANHETILNYCLYNIFNNVPVNLFYNALPADSVTMFEEHQLNISANALSSLINELYYFYLKTLKNGDDSDLSKQVFQCLEKIFIRVNTEFVKSKGLDDSSTPAQQPTNMEKLIDDLSELEMTKKEKKKLKKEMNKSDKTNKEATKKICPFWVLFAKGSVVRLSVTKTLISLTSLTSFFGEYRDEDNENHFEKLNISKRLWFKLYKKNLFDIVFDGFEDQFYKSMYWLLGSHLLIKNNIYNVWSTINREWLEQKLKSCISTTMKSTAPFEFGQIWLKYFYILFRSDLESFYGQEKPFSAMEIMSLDYVQNESQFNVKLIRIIIDSFNKWCNHSKFRIYQLFLNTIFDEFESVLTPTGIHFAVELYFNLCYLTMKQCLEAKDDNDEAKSMIILITKQIHHLLELSMVNGENNEMSRSLQCSLINLNHLLFVEHTHKFYSDTETHSDGPRRDLYELFKTKLLDLYKKLFSKWNENYQLSILRFLSECSYECDHYFSYNYYYADQREHYESSLLKHFQTSNSKQKNKQHLETESAIIRHWKIENEEKLFDYSMARKKKMVSFGQCQTSNVNYRSLSLINIIPQLQEAFTSVLIDSVGYFDSMFEQLYTEPSTKIYNEILLCLFHLQFILKNENMEGNSLKNHLLDWMSKIYSIYEKKPDRNVILIGAKLVDVYIVIISKLDELSLPNEIQENLLPKLNAFTYCLLIKQTKELANLPMSERYKKVIHYLKMLIQENMTDGRKLYRKFIIEQLKLVCEEQDSKTFEVIILLESIRFMMDEDRIDDSTLKAISDILNAMCDNVFNVNNENFSKNLFCLNLPLLLEDFYKILFDQVDHLPIKLEDFENDLLKHLNVLLKRLFKLPFYNQSDNFHAFYDGFRHFLSSIFRTLCTNNGHFNQLIKNISILIINFMADKLIFNDKEIQSTISFDNSREMIDSFTNLLIEYSVTLLNRLDSDGPNSDNKDIVNVILMEFVAKLWKSFQERSTNFKEENDFSLLSTLYFQDDLHNQIYEFIDNYENDALKLTDNKILLKLELSNLYDNLKFIKINCLVASIIKQIFDATYLSPNCLKVLQLDRIEKISFDHQSNDIPSIFVLLKQMVVNFYLLDHFATILKHLDVVKLFRKENKNQIDKNEFESFQTTFDKCYQQFKTSLMDVLIPISSQIQKQTKTPLNFACYLCDEWNISYFNHVVQYLNIDWNDLLQETQLISNLRKQIGFEYLSMIENKKMNSILHFVNESFGKICEMNTTGSDPELVASVFGCFRGLPSKTIQNFLISMNVSFQLDEIVIKSKLLDILRVLSRIDFTLYFKMRQFPDISQIEYPICWLTATMLEQSLSIVLDQISLVELKLFTALYKQWIEMIFLLPGEEENNPFSSIMLCRQILKSFQTFIKKCQLWMANNEEQKPEMCEYLRNFFAYYSQNLLLPFFVSMTDSFEMEPLHDRFMHQLSNVLLCINSECLKDMAMLELNKSLLIHNDDSHSEQTIKSLQEQLDSLSSNLSYLHTNNGYYKYILEHVTPLLMKNDHRIIYVAYHLISTTIQVADWKTKTAKYDQFFFEESETLNSDLTLSQLNSCQEDQDEFHCLPPKILVCLLEKLFDSVSIEDLNAQATYAYLLVWTIYLRLLARFPYNENENKIRLDLINYLMDKKLHVTLFENLFRLFDNYALSVIEDIVNNSTKDKQLCSDVLDDDHLCRMAVWLYYDTLYLMPNVLRSWFNTIKYQEQKELVDEITRKCFTRTLIENELHNLTAVDDEQLGNIKIKFRQKTTEIFVVYSLKEISFVIKFEFKPNHPLTPVSIECCNKSGVKEDVSRKWFQQLTIFFHKMNGSILDGIIMIKPNMDKFFEGIEECMICLFVLYSVSGQLPRFKCPQCKKKFHTACIKKWFQTHHSATCPQCKFEFK